MRNNVSLRTGLRCKATVIVVDGSERLVLVRRVRGGGREGSGSSVEWSVCERGCAYPGVVSAG